ncbi:PIG-L deacetylase family protein [Spelaeicoccus albus]|uniref:LmbE family N-acetylglucosaminyl deacetylase n=1 Tax=Spelaeicoccus albus TaxID=1280376 RepID=A0A7Z0D4V5_9MICO|nr:PIG-L family deacetylase [Spelaeicoccus albus]NYI68851.1 LmbE family N-acetylglucosaminyl deacetylase [Spelaeicoccus albus]
MTEQLKPLPDDWQRALVVMAHPDDPEYGVAAAVAVWTAAGKDVRYVLATKGEAGIAGMPPDESGPLRADEQRRACSHVGVSALEFLDYPDGRIEEGLQLRRDIAAQIRRHRPELVVTLNHRDAGWRPGGWNTADHRAVGRSVLDAVADAANEWIFPELTEEPWAGVRWIAVAGPEVTHAVEVAAGIESAVASLAEHRRYLEALSADPVPDQARRQVEMVTAPREDFGGRRAVAVELFGDI